VRPHTDSFAISPPVSVNSYVYMHTKMLFTSSYAYLHTVYIYVWIYYCLYVCMDTHTYRYVMSQKTVTKPMRPYIYMRLSNLWHCLYLHQSTYIQMILYTYTSISMCTYIYIYLYLSIFLSIYLLCVYIDVCMYVCLYVGMYICMFVYI